MKIKIYQVLIASTILFLNLNPIKAQDFNKEKLDSLFDRMESNDQAMGNFTIAKKGEIIYSRSLGFSNILGNETIKNNSNTQFRIGSISKVFTATIIFQLIDEHKLSLDTRLVKFFPKIPGAEQITIGTLLSHKSGLFDFVNDVSDKSFLTKPQSRAKILSFLQYGQLHFKPNADQLYSNSSYLLLTMIIEKITKRKYHAELQERICKKLNLKRTFSPTSQNLGITKSYYYKEKWTEITDLYPTNITGVGDILSTPTELILFLESLLSNKLISSKSLEIMKNPKGNFFGFGLMKVPFGTKIGYGHGGDTYGTHSLVASFEKDSLTIALCDNGERYPHNDIAIAMLSIYYKEIYELPEFNFFNYTPKDLDRYVGNYSSKQMPLHLTVSRKANKLIAQASGQSPFPLESIKEGQFYFRAANLVLEFQVEKDEMLLKQHGTTYLFQKVKSE